MEYIRLCKDLTDKGQLIPVGKDLSAVYAEINKEKDNYYSIFYYNENHKKQFDEKGTITGITDVTTDRLVFDFDSDDEKLSKQENIELSRKDALEIVKRLKKEGFGTENIQVYFSGGKGFEVSVKLDGARLTPKEAKNIGMNLAEGLKTFDPVVYNASRIFRLPLTKHQKSGLYKSPLTADDLESMTTVDIMENAKHNLEYTDIKDAWKPAKLSAKMLQLKDKAPEVTAAKSTVSLGFTADDIDWSTMPKDYKPTTWLLEMGFYPQGSRNRALLILASRYRYLNMTQTKAYYLLKASADAQSERTGAERVHKKEIWSVVNSVYGELWNGATFSDEEEPLLTELNSLVPVVFVQIVKEDVLPIQKVSGLFKEFASNIDQNRLTFGIKEIDDNLDALVGRSYIIGGSPGCGKTSLALQIMNNTSVAGIRSIFFSFDMSLEDVYQKLIQKHFKINSKQVYEQIKNPERLAQFEQVLKENYGNVHFVRSSGMTLEAMKNRISQIEKAHGPVKLLITDYMDLVQADFSDSTQKSMVIMQGLKSIGSEMRKCNIILAQPNKANQKINEPVTSYAAIKGSSAVAELANAVLWVHRPGASARGFENDLYYGIDCLKNRHGALFAIDLKWEGISGTVSSLDATGKVKLEQLRQELKEAKQKGEEDLF